jgi:hypothetical protein
MSTNKTPKTYKREVAGGMLGLLFVFAMWFAISGSNTVWTVVEYITPFIFIFAGGAFGIDAVLKQSISNRGQKGDSEDV